MLMSSLLSQALLHASVACRRKLIVDWVAAGDLEDATAKEVRTDFNSLWSVLFGFTDIEFTFLCFTTYRPPMPIKLRGIF